MDARRRIIGGVISGSSGGINEVIDTDNYLTIYALEDGLTASLSTNACEYCIDGNGNWLSLAAGATTQSINTGQTLSFRGNLTPKSKVGIGTFTISKKCNLEGNCMSMLFGDNAVNNLSLSGKNYAFYELFYDCTNIVSVSSNFLPATTLADRCYSSMFRGCTNLTTAPELPATTLANNCYYWMFCDCTSLITAPELITTILAEGCYSGMFRGCTNLTTAPELPATTLANNCYSNMFYGCTSLTTAPELITTILAEGCYSGMFYDCTSLTTAPELPATTLANWCYANMFRGCTNLTTAPELPATTLAEGCYYWMFYNCSKLNYIKMLATDISATICLYSWVYSVSSTGTFVKNPAMTTLPTGVDGIPSGWTVVNDSGSSATDNYLTIYALEDGLTASLSEHTCEYCIDGDSNWKSLSAGTTTESVNTGHILSFRGNLAPVTNIGIGTFTISKRCNLEGNCMSMLFGDNAADNTSLSGKNYAFYKLFYNCTNIVSVSENFLPATTLANYCYQSMFQGCTSLTTAPELPATTLASFCYSSMFSGCTSLTTAPELPATTLASYCYSSMFSGCTSLTTAPELPATTLASYCCQSMFLNCSSLTTAPALPATTLASSCYNGMFQGCTSLTTAPELLATTLANYCYQYMFSYCSKLNYIKMLATDISASSCLTGWVSGVASTGTFVKHASMTTLPTGVNGIPSGWNVVDDYIPTSCTSLTITADDVSGRDTTTTIYYTAVTNGKDSSGNTINNITITGTATSASFAQNTSTTNTVQRTISYTYLGKTATTTITQGVWVAAQYTIDLNNQWQKSTTISNPDASEYDGVYESFSNYNVNSTAAIMKITIDGYSSFKFYIRSNAESSWDYVMVSQLDQTIDNNTSYSNTTLVKAHTRGNQQSGTALSNYTLVEFTNIDGGKHVITIVYRKDSSSHSGTDKGYLLIPKIAGDSSGSGGDTGGDMDINNYLTIVALTNGLTASLSTNACEYCIDGNGNWLSLAAGATTQSINTGQTLSFRGNLTPKSKVGIGTFTISKKCNLEGNCMSMLFGDNAANSTSLTGKNYAFYKLFYNCTNIVSVSENFLPATTLASNCYGRMFLYCTNLTTAPDLPATTLVDYCYNEMFRECTKLTTAPDLPATTLADWCYYNMFQACTNLTTAPDLPATTLTEGCYNIMFSRCSELKYIKMLATDISASDCLGYWVQNVSSTGTFVKNPAMTSLPTGVSGIPSGWTVLNDDSYEGQ